MLERRKEENLLQIYLGKKKIDTQRLPIIGQGGEADIYQLGKYALKIYKTPRHPDFDGQPLEQKAAKEKIITIQTKLPAFPKDMPNGVITPIELAYSVSNNKIAGYLMPFVDNTELLLEYRKKGFRDKGILNSDINEIFMGLRDMVSGIHKKNAIIGDFNDLNVLVKNHAVFLIDADSFSYKQFHCSVYTERFLDPLRVKDSFFPIKPPSRDSDWYAFTIMLMQSYLLIGPYGGVIRPRKTALQRFLQRITVFDSNIIYPRSARPLDVLPDDMSQYFLKVFGKDFREEFPQKLIENTRWTVCSNCGTEHCRAICPKCSAKGIVDKKIVFHGNVKAENIFQIKGDILYATTQNSKLHWLYYENGSFKREDGSVVVNRSINRKTRYRISGRKTIFGTNSDLEIFDGSKKENIFADNFNMLCMFDANSENIFFAQEGKLMKNNEWGDKVLASVSKNNTLFWVGERFGFGFYRLSGYDGAFVFDVKNKGFNDRIDISFLGAQLFDSTVLFYKDKCWFLATLSSKGKLQNHCWLINQKGEVLAHEVADEGDDSWLSKIRGKVALRSKTGNEALLCATDSGIVRVEYMNGIISVSIEYPDTAPFVDSNSHLFISREGLMVVSRHSIKKISIS